MDAVANEPPQDIQVLYGDGIEVTNSNRFTVYHLEGRVSWVYSTPAATANLTNGHTSSNT